jgi:quercetin 2,3-dioxygenase
MPAVTVDTPLTLPRLARPSPDAGVPRPVELVVSAHEQTEGAGVRIWRPFPGQLPLAAADPFLLLDQAGPRLNGPREARGPSWHPNRGIETVTYILDGEVAHHDSNGGGGVIGEGDTQWMTAGAGHPGSSRRRQRDRRRSRLMSRWRITNPIHQLKGR